MYIFTYCSVKTRIASSKHTGFLKSLLESIHKKKMYSPVCTIPINGSDNIFQTSCTSSLSLLSLPPLYLHLSF